MTQKYLGKINSPEDLKKLNNEQVTELCAEIREFMLKTVADNGGHLASNLGAVELTVALHKVFSSPEDTIVFDVGHQCYTHKLLTGRYSEFSTLRKENGISGFMKPDESRHDPFITGHSSTSVSSAFGVCKANQLLGDEHCSVAVIGDGALTGGMVYEALNNVSKKDKNLIVVLNDNKMSISKNRGALSKHLSAIRTRRNYFKFKNSIESFLLKIPLIGHGLYSVAFKFKNIIKSAVYDSNIFESLGFYYMGPVDGHDVEKMTEIFDIAKNYGKPVLVHVKTVKGKGYVPAELDPGIYHGVSHFDPNRGIKPENKNCFSSVFGDVLCDIASKDPKVCAITAAMSDGTGLTRFAAEYKNRFFDVGIAEEHAVTFSAALAKKGFKPVFAVYSTFLQRGYDQVIHDAAIQGLPLTLAVDRAGFVGADGETHQGLFDVSFLSSVPGVKIYAPADYTELEYILRKRLDDPKGVAAIRYPRGSAENILAEPLKINDEYSVYGAGNVAVITYGTLTATAVDAMKELEAQNIKIAVIKLNTVFPLSDLLLENLCSFDALLTFEEGIENGSVSEKIGAMLMQMGYRGRFKINAVNGFVKQASVDSQRRQFGLCKDSMIRQVKEVLEIEQ